MKSLLDLYKDHEGKVSDKWSLYLHEYERLLHPYRAKRISLLEIGIQNGGSLELWSKYFPNAEHLVGCDINPKCSKLSYDDSRISVIVANANTDQAFQSIAKCSPSFDLILDDGSHTSSDIVKSFSRYFPILNDGGLFITEDIHCSYWQEFEGGLFMPQSSISFFKRLADLVNFEHWGHSRERRALLKEFRETYEIDFDEECLAKIHSVAFINSMCVIEKKDIENNVLGPRYIAGKAELVVSGHLEISGTMLEAPNQSNNFWSSMECAPDERWRNDYQRLGKLEKELNEIINSKSWKLTKPLRFIGQHARTVKSKASTISSNFISLTRMITTRRFTVKKIIQKIIEYGLFGFFSLVFSYLSGHAGKRLLSEIRYSYKEPLLSDDVKIELNNFLIQPLISIVMPVYNVDPKWLDLAIKSVESQWYKNWELCLADDCSTNEKTIEYLKSINKPKIKLVFLDKNQGISSASNAALNLATGKYIALMDNDDEITPDALFEVVKAINNSNADFIYSDEDFLTTRNQYVNPHYKPDFSPDLLLSHNYITHFAVVRRDLLQQIGSFNPEYDGAQDFDLFLRITEQANKIHHIPRVLYHWRMIETSTSYNSEVKPEALTAGKKALESALQRRNLQGKVENANQNHYFRVKYSILNNPLVSIVIPFKDKPDLLKTCIESILDKSSYSNFEIIGISNNSSEQATFSEMDRLENRDKRVKFYQYDIPFNYSKINNHAVNNYAKGEHIILLNNDIEIISPDWIKCMLEYSQQERVGCVGAKLYYPNDKIQHAGVIIGVGGVAGHSHRGYYRSHLGYFNRLHVAQNISAVTAACLMVKACIYHEVNGLNETDFKVAFNDVDFCLRVLKHGYNNIFTPFAEAYHHESISRGYETTPEKIARFKQEQDAFHKRHQGILEQGDPYYNRNLTLAHEDFSLAVSYEA